MKNGTKKRLDDTLGTDDQSSTQSPAPRTQNPVPSSQNPVSSSKPPVQSPQSQNPASQPPEPSSKQPATSNQQPESNTNLLFVYASTELLQQGKSARFRAPGHSMHPSIKNEDIITVVPIAPLGVKVGDVILYRTVQSVIAHRVVRIKKNKGTPHFILRADALGASKEQVTASQVLGKVVFVERSGAGIDIYSIKTKVFRLGYNFALRLRRWMV